LHLDGILFPHINDDARSKSHQIWGINVTFLCAILKRKDKKRAKP